MDRHPRSLFFPLLLIVVGALLLLNSLKVIPGDTWDFLWRLWPLVLVIGGLDGLYQRNGYAGPLVIIGLGSILLLSNLGYLATGAWTLALRLWPVLIIAIGLDLMVGRRSPLSAILGLLLGIVLIGVIFYLAAAAPGTTARNSLPIDQALEGAERISLTAEPFAGTLEIESGLNTGRRIEGTLQFVQGESIKQDYTLSEGTGLFELRSMEPVSTFFPAGMPGMNQSWLIRLPGDLPVELSTSLIMGETKLSLQDLQVKQIDAETVMGRMELSLPAGTALEGSARVVIGELRLFIPQDAAVILDIDTGITATSLPEGYVRQGNAIYSPRAFEGKEAQINLQLELPIGSLQVESLP